MEISISQAYSLGLLWADGYFLEKRNELRLEVTTEDFKDFQSPLMSLGRLEIALRQRPNRQHQTRATIRDKKLCMWLKTMDFLNKSLDSPTKILNFLDEKNKVAFLLGWSDGDGCFYANKKNKCYQFVMAGSFEQDWTALEGVLKKLEIKYKINKVESKNGNKSSGLRITGLYNLSKLISHLYSLEDERMGLSRKKEKAAIISESFNKSKVKIRLNLI